VWFRDGDKIVKAVNGIDLDVGERQTVALVGESGCGKSVTALSLSRLLPQPPASFPSGEIALLGNDVLRMNARQIASLRGNMISYVFQDPGTSLNPVLRVGFQIMEAIRAHRPQADARQEALRLLGTVGLPDPEMKLRAYPHEMSGGQQQRAMIAMALACNPRLLVADEPTTALDVTIQAQILQLLSSLQRERGMAVLLITHNLGLVADVAHTTNVMYAGFIVESGDTEEVLSRPAHPYTRGLLDAVPRMDTRKRMRGIDGSVPRASCLPDGCPFAPRCSRVDERCRCNVPDVTDVEAAGGNDDVPHRVRCFFPLENR